MARKKANYPLVEGLEITTLAAEGKAMGRWNDVVVFVPMTVPGDVVDVQIRSKRRRFMEGFVVNYVKNRRCVRSRSASISASAEAASGRISPTTSSCASRPNRSATS